MGPIGGHAPRLDSMALPRVCVCVCRYVCMCNNVQCECSRTQSFLARAHMRTRSRRSLALTTASAGQIKCFTMVRSHECCDNGWKLMDCGVCVCARARKLVFRRASEADRMEGHGWGGEISVAFSLSAQKRSKTDADRGDIISGSRVGVADRLRTRLIPRGRVRGQHAAFYRVFELKLSGWGQQRGGSGLSRRWAGEP